MDSNVSVIITTYKRSTNILKRAIESVLKQTYPVLEVIVVDDNRDSEYLNANQNFINEYNSSIVHYQVNSGIHGACAARNLGVLLSKGEYIAFLDDDDEWKKKKIERMLPCFSDNIGLVYCNSDYYRGDVRIEKNVVLPKRETDDYVSIIYSNYIGGCSIPILKKSVFVAAGKFDESLPASQDIDLWLRIVKISSIYHVDEALVNYYITDESITRNLEKQNQARIYLLEKYASDYNKYPLAKESRVERISLTMVLQGKTKHGMSFYNCNSTYMGLNKGIRMIAIVVKGKIKSVINKVRGYN